MIEPVRDTEIDTDPLKKYTFRICDDSDKSGTLMKITAT